MIYLRNQERKKVTAPVETHEEQAAKEVLGAFKKFGLDNANPTKSILRKTGITLQEYSNVFFLIKFSKIKK